MEARFEWDPRKAARNLLKHRVSFTEALTVFADPLARIVDDPRHSRDEPRYILLGTSVHNRLVVVMYTERGEAIRLISARKATERERKSYEES